MARARDPKTGRYMKTSGPITGAVATVTQGDLERRRPKRWTLKAVQLAAWKMWHELGVLHYPTSFKADAVSRCNWNVYIGENQLEEKAAKEAVAAVCEPATVREVSRLLALNLEVAGEVWHRRKSDAWAVIASAHPKYDEQVEGADILVRGWIADPVDPDTPDSAVFAALDICEEIRVLQALSRAQSRSRIGQRGLLLRPSEFKFPEDDDFTTKFREAMTTPLGDEYAAAAVVPMDVEGPGEYIEKWRHLILESPYDDKLDTRLEAALKRLALALNMSPELLLGNMDSNHWNAWLSDETNYRGHIEPLANEVGSIFAQAMEDATGEAGIRVTPDPTELLARRSSVADAFEGARIGAVSLKYVRRMMGADEADKPTPEDLKIIAAMIGQTAPGEEPEKPAIPAQGNGQVPVIGPPEQNGAPVVAAVSDDEASLDALAEALTDIEEEMFARMVGAAEVMADRVLAIPDDKDVQETLTVEAEGYGRVVARIITQGRSALSGLGVDSDAVEWDQAQEVARETAVDGMRDWLLDVVNKTPSEMPAVPSDLVRRVLAIAGGSDTAVVAAVQFSRPRNILPKPETWDPQSFATGVLTTKQLKGEGIALTQFRWRYGDLSLRSQPFFPHKEQDGRFTSPDGTVGGWYVGDHKGCRCAYLPVYRKQSQPQEV